MDKVAQQGSCCCGLYQSSNEHISHKDIDVSVELASVKKV